MTGGMTCLGDAVIALLAGRLDGRWWFDRNDRALFTTALSKERRFVIQARPETDLEVKQISEAK
ncbi:MAG: hypothetical protein AAGI88_15305 [Pseudomonadota bacterium]